jgi:hypothetical protein
MADERPRRTRLAVAALRLYPRDWRARYGDEVAGLLERRRPRLADALDLARGAVDARLHPSQPSRLPGLAAVTGGAIWTLWSIGTLASPTPPDWPGYSIEMLPSAILAVACFLVAVIGAWLRLGDGANRFERLAITIALAGHLAWAMALGAALAGVAYGPMTAIASSAAAIGTGLVGFALLGRGDLRIGALVALAAVGLLIPAPTGWLTFGLGWSAAGITALSGARPVGPLRGA